MTRQHLKVLGAFREEAYEVRAFKRVEMERHLQRVFLGWIVTGEWVVNGTRKRESPVGFYSATISQAMFVAMAKLNMVKKTATTAQVQAAWDARAEHARTKVLKLQLSPVYAH